MDSLIWTRGREDWAHDLVVLKKSQQPFLHLPCIHTELLEIRPKDIPVHFDAWIFTSPKAIAAIQNDQSLSPLMAKVRQAYTFGIETSAAAERCGFDVERYTEVGTGEEFASALCQTLVEGAVVCWPSAREVAFDVTVPLQASGIKCIAIPVYQTKLELTHSDGRQPTAQEVDVWKKTLSGTVCFASPSAVKSFVQTLDPRNNRLGSVLTARCIGPTTARACRDHFQHIEHVAEPNIAALVSGNL